MKKIILLWSLVVIWMGVIFYLSSMNTEESNGKSKEVIDKVVDTTIDTTNHIGLTKENVSSKKKEKITDTLNKPLRKCAHASVYFILSILILNALLKTIPTLNQKQFLSILIAIFCCFIYACTDEYHQTFVSGRTGQFSDVLIDTLGATIACFLYTRLLKRKKRFFLKIIYKNCK